MIIYDIIFSTLANKCPRCHGGNIFESGNPYNFKSVFRMNSACSCCGLKYEREPGFFYGAMYVSYALMSGIFILWFISDLLWLHLSAQVLSLLVLASMLAFFPVAYRWARIIWLNFFIRFDKEIQKENCLEKQS